MRLDLDDQRHSYFAIITPILKGASWLRDEQQVTEDELTTVLFWYITRTEPGSRHITCLNPTACQSGFIRR
jgi:hypothetical protein